MFARPFFKRGHSPKLLWHGRLSPILYVFGLTVEHFYEEEQGWIDPILPRNCAVLGGKQDGMGDTSQVVLDTM